MYSHHFHFVFAHEQLYQINGPRELTKLTCGLLLFFFFSLPFDWLFLDASGTGSGPLICTTPSVFPTGLSNQCFCSTERQADLLSFSSKSHSCWKATKDVLSRPGFRPSGLRFLLQHQGFLPCFTPYSLTDLSATCAPSYSQANGSYM